MNSEKKIKVIIAEDKELIRKGLISLLNNTSDIEVMREAENGQELLKLLVTETPDIVLTDLEMPVMSGIEAIESIRQMYPGIRIIVLSSHGETIFISEMIKRGVNAFLEKNCNTDDIYNTIRKVYNEGYHFSSDISKEIVFSSLEIKTFLSVYRQMDLTDREMEILKLVCREKTNVEIASMLDISQRTVEFHRKNIYEKTFTDSSVGLIKYAIRKGVTGIS